MEKRVRFYNTLYFRMLLIFGIAFSGLLLIVGVVFLRIYSDTVIKDYKNQLLTEANQIADNVEEYSINNEEQDYVNYMDASSAMLETQMVDVWVLPNYVSSNSLNEKFLNVNVTFDALSDPMRDVVLGVIDTGSPKIDENYDEIYGSEVIHVAVPVHDGGGRIDGIVLLNAVSESQNEIIDSCYRIIKISLIIAWAVSFFATLFFARRISRPVSRLRQNALVLAGGDYSVTTGISGNSEIGQLGEAMDILSEKLSENEKMRDDFFANVSHELRTPITVVRGYVESLADGYVTDKDQVNHTLRRMLSECKTMERLVEDLLTLSKMQNPDFTIEKEYVSVVQIFEDVIRSGRVLSEKKNIEISFMSDDEYGFMMGDYDRLRQMFMIILDNAIKFSHKDNKVEVSVHIVEDTMSISIQDYGVGISEEALPNIFEKFYKSKLQMNEKGSGLGLMIAKQIAIKHDGDISVSSKLGEGTCFVFKFKTIDPPEDL